MSTPSFHQLTPREEHEDELSPEEISARKRKRIWIACMLVIILAGGIVAFNARSISRGIKGWQAERIAREAEKLLAAKDYAGTQGKIQDALALSPQNTVAMRTAARFLSSAGAHRDAIGFWKQLEERTPLSGDDERKYASSLLATGDLLQASGHLKRAWPPGQPGTPDDWMIALTMALQRRDETDAIDLARKLMLDAASSSEQKLKAATLLTSAPDPEQRVAAWQRIETLSQNKDETGLEALIALARRSAAPSANSTAEPAISAEAVAAAIDANPKARAKHFLFAMDLRLLANPLRKPEMITAAQARFAKTDDDLEALGAWLYGKGEYRKVLDHLPPKVAARRRSLFLQSLDAMAAMGQWREVATSINDAHFALDRVTAEMYLARCSKELGEKAGEQNHWDAAFDAANGNAQQLAAVADYAEHAGNLAVAKAGFLAATHVRADFLPAFQKLLAIAQAEGDTAGLNITFRRMAKQWPNEAAVRNDLAYTDLLLGKNLEDSARTAEALFAKEPNSLPHRITLSLARLRAGDHAEALNVLENLSGSLGNLEGRKRAVHAAALWTNDRQSDAQNLLQGLDRNRLLAEERALVAEIP